MAVDRSSLAPRGVISVIGRDQKGIVARISTYLASRGVNIEDIQQRVVEGLFIMTMLVDLADVDTTLDEIILGLKKIGGDIGLEVTLRLHGGRERKRFAMLVSREPHCLQTLLRDHRSGQLSGDPVLVLSNHETLREIAEEAGLPFFWHPANDKRAHEAFLLEKLRESHADLVVLARYMQILTPEFVARFPHQIINIHPSLLPHHPGANAYKQAWEEGVRVSGCTAHLVTELLDQGPIILQDVFPIRVGEDTLEDVRTKGRALEGEVLSQAVQLFLNDQLIVKDNKVIFRPGRLQR
ncbi:MAG: formyltetrahydrofolate deformylase [Candidatus Binatota bacterium]|jgi:formyltetrahydrofolate deformylase|nr:formyltetrahydrofolate deformylase [Candidatus Binatota bacterium]